MSGAAVPGRATSISAKTGWCTGARSSAVIPAFRCCNILDDGLTFFDDDVINFFSPHAKGKSAIFLLAIGKPLKRKPQQGL